MGITVKGLRCGHDDIQYGFQPGPNSAGGVSIKGVFVNNSSKSIKYISLYFTPYNQVGDAVGCNIKNVSEYGLKCTGPVAPNQSYDFFGENMWYNHSISSVKVTRARIQYMDGSEEGIPGSDISVEAGGGCYVATAVYGSYDCPQVWTLRRYRDYTLAETWYGRAFIRTYYAISPTLVKWFGHTEWFKKMWKGRLDRMVATLNAEGVDDTPYEDRNW